MLTIRAAKNPGYYEQVEFARDDYYAERGATTGRWVGGGSAAAGLSGAVAEDHLATLLEGVNPATNEPLAASRSRTTNAGFDLTFASPKSLSVLAAVGGEGVRQAVLAAQQAGVADALDYLDASACFVRRGHGGATVLPAQGFAGAIYTHEMSRSADPHLHTHLVIANRVKGPDGRWTAPDMRAVYGSSKVAGAICDARIRAELTRSLGIGWERGSSGAYEVAGIPRAVLEHFSARHAEILEEAAARGWTSAAGIAVLQRETRDHKPQLDRETAQARWQARAAEHGLGRDQIAGLVGRRRPDPQLRDDQLAELASSLAGRAGLTARGSTYTRAQVIEAFADAHPAGASLGRLEDLAERFMARHAIPVRAAEGHRPATFTTAQLLDTEARLLERATDADSGQVTPQVAGEVTEAVLAAHPGLGPDQAAAVRQLAGAGGPVAVLEARAGTGKTTTLRALAEVYRAAGVPVIGTAWQGQAAQLLAREAGVEAHTTARILDRVGRGLEPIPYGALVIVDEAGMMGTHPLEQLAEHVGARAGRLLLTGDRHQLAPLDAGGAFGALADRLGAATLTENRRQREPLQRLVADHLAAGRAPEAIALLHEHGKLATHADAREARAELVAWWVAARGPAEPDQNLVLAHDRRDVRALNALCRREMEREGRLGQQRLEAFGREWAVGDRLVCRANDYRQGLDVRNGTRGTVVDLDSDAGDLVLGSDDGRRVRLPHAYLENARYGYALTGHVSQGETCQRTFLLASPERGGREWAYVAGSRHRIDLRVFLTHHEPEAAQRALGRAWGRSEAKQLALEQVVPERRSESVARARAELAALRPEAMRARAGAIAQQLAPLSMDAARADSAVRQAAQLGRRLSQLDQKIATNAERVRGAGDRLADIGPLARRARREARAELSAAQAEGQGLAEARRRLVAERVGLPAQADGAGERVAALRGELAGLRARLGDHAIAAEITRPCPATRAALGPRPTDAGQRERWERACAAVAVCRELAGVGPQEPELFGRAPQDVRDHRRWAQARDRARELVTERAGRQGRDGPAGAPDRVEPASPARPWRAPDPPRQPGPERDGPGPGFGRG